MKKIPGFYIRALNSHNIRKNYMETLQISTSNNFVNTGLILKIQIVFKSE